MGRTFSLASGVMGKTFTTEGSVHTDVCAGAGQGLKCTEEGTVTLTEGAPGLTHPQLISRGADIMEEMNRALPNGSNGSNGLPAPHRLSLVSTEKYDFFFNISACLILLFPYVLYSMSIASQVS